MSISIHGSREGTDIGGGKMLVSTKISIHGSREGTDDNTLSITGFLKKFQSTAPVREPTAHAITGKE